MQLRELIEALEGADQDYVAPIGFGAPMSYCGYYHDVAFEPARNVTVASMLEHAKSALGATFVGYKGGQYTMYEDVDCYIAEYDALGDEIGPVLIAYLTGQF
jgi:hypothetical protein